VPPLLAADHVGLLLHTAACVVFSIPLRQVNGAA